MKRSNREQYWTAKPESKVIPVDSAAEHAVAEADAAASTGAGADDGSGDAVADLQSVGMRNAQDL